jgi:hypothetical protein
MSLGLKSGSEISGWLGGLKPGYPSLLNNPGFL